MNDQQMQEIADRVVAALEGLAPRDPWWWTYVAALASVALMAAVIVVTVVGLRNLRREDNAFKRKVATDAGNLRRTRGSDTDAMNEWWRRAQWALNATASTNDTMYSYGIGILGVLTKSDLASSEEKSLFDTVWEGSCTKMRDKEIRHLLEQLRDAPRQDRGGPLIGEFSKPESGILGTANEPPVSGESGSSEDESHVYRRGDGRSRKDEVFAKLGREILAARLKVTLDEQLNRETSPTVTALAQMKLPPIVR